MLDKIRIKIAIRTQITLKKISKSKTTSKFLLKKASKSKVKKKYKTQIKSTTKYQHKIPIKR